MPAAATPSPAKLLRGCAASSVQKYDLLNQTAVKENRELSPGDPLMSPRDESSSLALPHNHPARRLPRRRNINRLPFRRSGRLNKVKSPACKNGTTLSLRTGSPASKCCSRGTLLHFSLQSSHLNICYCHQDLHQGRLHATSQSAASPQYIRPVRFTRLFPALPVRQTSPRPPTRRRIAFARYSTSGG